VIFIDTLNRAAPGLDENSSQDMGRVLAGMKRLQELTGGLVLIVHHTGKDASKGLRGHSSLFAALDGAIEVERSATGRCWSAAKVKDGEDGKQIAFRLHVVDLGKDADGDPMNSCAVERDVGAMFRPNPPQGQHQKSALAVIRSSLGSVADFGKAGTGQQTPCLRLDEAVKIAADALVGVDKKRRTPRAREAVQGLVIGGHLRRGLDGEQEEWVWL
jgi:putative DNA primase/helicase